MVRLSFSFPGAINIVAGSERGSAWFAEVTRLLL